MIRFRLSLLLLIFFFTSAINYGQKVFRDGYIVNKSGQTLNGLVEYSVNQGTPANCRFKRFEIANEVFYSADDIKAFGYRSGNRYESRTISNRTSFYEVLASGSIMLFRRGSEFYIEKDKSGLISLNKVPVSYTTGGQEVKYKTTSEFLQYITEGKVTIPAQLNLKSDLVPVIAEYNRKAGEASKVYNRALQQATVDKMALISGSNMNIPGVFSGVGGYLLFMEKMALDYVPAPATEFCPVFGLSYERLLSRKSGRLSLTAEFMGFRQTFYTYSEGKNFKGTVRNDAFYDFTAVKLPIMLRYSLTGKKVVPFANAGIAVQYLIDSNFRRTEEIENSSHEITTSEYDDFTFNPLGISVVAGIGVKTRLFNRIFINIQGRAEYGGCLFKDTSETDTGFTGSSLQPYLILGITF